MRNTVLHRIQCLAASAVVVAALPGFADERPAPRSRLSVTVLPFKCDGDDEESAHWRYCILDLLDWALDEIKSMRVLPRDASLFAFNHLKLKPGQSLEVEQVRAVGELMETRRVVWGVYRRHEGKWQVSERLLNVATGENSEEITAEGSDWFEIRDQLVNRMLRELRVTATEEEQTKMLRRWTASAEALESYSKALALQEQQQPLSQRISLLERAISADPRFAEAHLRLAVAQANLSQLEAAQTSAREALRLRPDYTTAHVILGKILTLQQKHTEAGEEYRTALRLDPDDPLAWHALGEYHWQQQRPQQAAEAWQQASRTDVTSAELHAHLGLAFALKPDREKASGELKLAEWYNSENDMTELLLANAYAALRELPAAIEHIEKYVAWSRKQGMSPQETDAIDQWGQELKKRLMPEFLTVSPPQPYTAHGLEAALRSRLTRKEFRQVANPIAATPAMTNWARELTLGAKDDWEKSHELFDALSRHLASGPGGSRTAQEVFAVWKNPNESFSCQEYAKLFIALARAIEVNTFYVHLERDYTGRIVYHDCAAVFAKGKAALVDPAYLWFGAPHKAFVVLDDMQTIAHHYFQAPEGDKSSWLSHCRLAAKLHPDFAWGQCMLARSMLQANHLLDAEKALGNTIRLEPNRWDAYELAGVLADRQGNFDKAAVSFQKSLALNPDDGTAHFDLAHVLLKQKKLKEASDEFRFALEANLEPDAENDARRHLAQISEGFVKNGADSGLAQLNIAPPESGMTALARGLGPEVVLVHGSLGDYRQWTPIADRLQKSYRVIVVSRRYHWPNPPPSGKVRYSYESNAEDLLSLLRSVGHPVHLVGHSYGAGVALLAALHEPNLIRSLALIEPAFGSLLPSAEPGLDTEKASRDSMLNAVHVYVDAGQFKSAAITLIDWVEGGDHGFSRMPTSARNILLANAKTIGPTFFSGAAPQLTEDQLRNLHVPTLVVNGEHTRMFYRLIGQTVATRVPGAESIVISDTGHMTIIENPKQNARALLAFIKRH